MGRGDPNRLTLKSLAALEGARIEAVARSRQAVGPEHLLHALLDLSAERPSP